MEIFIIVLLILVGVILMLAEIFLLPGVTVSAIFSICSFVASLYYSYEFFGTTGFIISLVISVVLLGILFFASIRKKNLSRISLENKIDSKSSENANLYAKLGQAITAKTRLNPMGSVWVDGKILEARSINGYVDAGQEVIVVGFEDSVILVK